MESKVLGGRYELIECVGKGGMAIVYKANDNMLGRNVAVKILREEFKENEEFIRRFKVESQAAASLSHQNIVQIYDVGEEDGLHYIVMELLEGETLKTYMSAHEGTLPTREAMNVAMQICRALEHAHSKHVVHRDIKPQNIVLTEDGKIKVADFGIARAANNTTTVNSGSYAVGSAHYLSPEQARGGYTDNKSDIYSFGVVLYELFTGKLPFDAEESIGVVMKHIHEEPIRPSVANPDVTPAIEAIILRAMCKEQRLRYANATEILEDLIAVYQNPSVSVFKLNAYNKEVTPVTSKSAKTSSSKSGNSSRSQRQAPAQRSTRPGRKKKKRKSSNKNVAIAITSTIIVFLILSVFAIRGLLFPETGEAYEIPDFVGMTFEEAAIEAERKSNDDVKFTVSIVDKVFSDEDNGTIISQTPESGFKIKRSREINVVVSRGPVVVKLSDYTGKDALEVSRMLEEKGLTVKIEQEESTSIPEGKIIKHLPSEGTQMGEGDEITFFVSKGAENTYVPDVVGKSEGDASAEIERWGLKVRVVKEPSETVLKDEVIRQNPKANTIILTGEFVEIVVSTGKEEKEEEKQPEQTTPEETTPAEDDTQPSTPPAEPAPSPETAGPKSVSIPLANLPKEGPTRVKVILDGKTVYDADVSTATGSATISFEVAAGVDTSKGADIYYNGAYITMKEVK